jgi:shikimate 5-dehydrogenase
LNILLKELEPLHAESRLCAFDLANPPVHEWPDDIVVINATSKELKLGERPPIDVSVLGNAAVIYDTIYQPTQLVADARDRGLRAADGLGMLVWQGASSLSIWLGNSGVHVGALGLAQTMMNAACDALQIPRRAIAS